MGMKSHFGGLCFLCLVLLIFNAGCTKVGPDFLRPPSSLSKNWLEVGDKRVKEMSPEDKQWWSVFNDPVLGRLIEIAYSGNLTLQTAGVRVLQARAQLGIAIGNQYPQSQQLNGLLQFNRLSDRSASVIQVPGVPATSLGYWQSQYGFQASWEIDFWGRFRRAIESADAGLLAAIANYDSTLVSLTGDVANSYIQIRTLQERLRIARENVATQSQSLEIADARFKGGTTTQRDVEQATTVLASTEATIPMLDRQIRQAQNGLCVLLGMPPGDLTELLADSSGIPAPPPEVAVGIPADLLSRRPDIRSAEAQAAAQCAQIGVAKADLFPSLSLFGSFGFVSIDRGTFTLGDMFRWGSRMAAFGPTLQWNVFNYGQITNNVRVQDALFQQAILSYQNAVLNAQQEGRERAHWFPERPGAGGIPHPERGRSRTVRRSGGFAVQGGHRRLHHGADGAAGAPPAAGQPGADSRRYFPQPCERLPRPGRRMGNARRHGFRPCPGKTGDGGSHQLGQVAGTGSRSTGFAQEARRHHSRSGLVKTDFIRLQEIPFSFF